jgi:hypothetical protein
MVCIMDQKLAEEVNSVILLRGETEKYGQNEFLLKKTQRKRKNSQADE